MYQQNKYSAIISDTAVSTYGGRVVGGIIQTISEQPKEVQSRTALSADGPFLVPNRSDFLPLLGVQAKRFIRRNLDSGSFEGNQAFSTEGLDTISPLYVSLRQAIEDYELHSSVHTAIENRDSNPSGTESPVDKILSLANENNTSASITVQASGEQLELSRNDLNGLSHEEKQALVFELAIRAVEKDDAAEAARNIQRLFEDAVQTPWVADSLMALDRGFKTNLYDLEAAHSISCKSTTGDEDFRAGLDPKRISSGALLRQLKRAFNDREPQWNHLREFCEKFRPPLDDVIKLATGAIVLCTIGKTSDRGLKQAFRDVLDVYGVDSGKMSKQWAESANRETNLEEWRKFYALCRIFYPEDSSKPAGAEEHLSKGQLVTTFNRLFGPPRLKILSTGRTATLDGLDLGNTCVESPEGALLYLVNCDLTNTVVRPDISTNVKIESPSNITNVTLVSARWVKFLLPKGSGNFKITGRIDPEGLFSLVDSQPRFLDLRGVTLVGDESDYSKILSNREMGYLRNSCLMTQDQASRLGILSDDTSSAFIRRLRDADNDPGGQQPNENKLEFVIRGQLNRQFYLGPTLALFEVLSSFLSQEAGGDLVRFRLHRDSIPRHDHQLVVEQFNEDTLVVYYHDPELFEGIEIRKVLMLTRDDAISVLCERSCGRRYDAKLGVLSQFLYILQDPAFSAATDVSWAKKNDESPRVQWTKPEPLTDFVFKKTEGQVRAERRTP